MRVSLLKKYAVIAGETVALPVDAKFYFQDQRGLWFWSSRKPRVMDGDWTPHKRPVQVPNGECSSRCLVAPITEDKKNAWRQSVMRTINLGQQLLCSAAD